MDEIKVGDRVRSFDFDGREDCYVEGVVRTFTELEGCKRYVIEATGRVFRDLVVTPEQPFYFPPVNGTPRFPDGVTNCVKKLED